MFLRHLRALLHQQKFQCPFLSMGILEISLEGKLFDLNEKSCFTGRFKNILLVASSLNCSLQHGLLKIISNLEKNAADSMANLCVLVFM